MEPSILFYRITDLRIDSNEQVAESNTLRFTTVYIHCVEWFHLTSRPFAAASSSLVCFSVCTLCVLVMSWCYASQMQCNLHPSATLVMRHERS